MCECQTNFEAAFAMYLLIVSLVSVCVCCSRVGHKQGVVSLQLVLVAWNKSSVVARSCDGVRSTLVMWSEHRAGSEKCWVAVWGSFYLEKEAASENADARWNADQTRWKLMEAQFKTKKTAMAGAFLVWLNHESLLSCTLFLVCGF